LNTERKEKNRTGSMQEGEDEKLKKDLILLAQDAGPKQQTPKIYKKTHKEEKRERPEAERRTDTRGNQA